MSMTMTYVYSLTLSLKVRESHYTSQFIPINCFRLSLRLGPYQNKNFKVGPANAVASLGAGISFAFNGSTSCASVRRAKSRNRDATMHATTVVQKPPAAMVALKCTGKVYRIMCETPILYLLYCVT